MKFEDIKKKIKADWDKIDLKQFEMGMKTELEHKDITKGDPILTAKIALAHLKEVPDYYTKLKKVETNVKKTPISKHEKGETKAYEKLEEKSVKKYKEEKKDKKKKDKKKK